MPLMLTRPTDPGTPEAVDMFTPATRPCRSWSTDRTSLRSDGLGLNDPMADVMSRLVIVPYPTTSTSSRERLCAVICTFISSDLPTVISWSANPKNENCSIASSFVRRIDQLPSASATVPLAVPFSTMPAPARGVDSSSYILPRIIRGPDSCVGTVAFRAFTDTDLPLMTYSTA